MVVVVLYYYLYYYSSKLDNVLIKSVGKNLQTVNELVLFLRIETIHNKRS